MNAIEYVEECQRLQVTFLGLNLEATLHELQTFWRWRSEQASAPWIGVPMDPMEDVTTWLPLYWDAFPELEPTTGNPRAALKR